MVKKLVLVFSMLVLLVSCASLNIRNMISEYNNTEAAFAMKYVMSQAHEETVKSLYKQLHTEENFIPEKYQILYENKDKIVGLKAILENWKTYASEYALDSIQSMTPEAESLVGELEFVNPKRFIEGSLSSGTELFKAKYAEQLKGMVVKKTATISLKLLEEATDYYNAYQKVQKNTELLEPPKEEDIISLALELLDRYFLTFAENEELIRTTPKANFNQTAAKVFGLD